MSEQEQEFIFATTHWADGKGVTVSHDGGRTWNRLTDRCECGHSADKHTLCGDPGCDCVRVRRIEEPS